MTGDRRFKETDVNDVGFRCTRFAEIRRQLHYNKKTIVVAIDDYGVQEAEDRISDVNHVGYSKIGKQ